ncbi:hypothetical protein CHUAL_013455 [Chamberlinius hualienensis]
MSSTAELEKMKVAELKVIAKNKGLSTVGTKKQLVERIFEASSTHSESTADSTLDATVDDDDEDVNEDYVLGEGDEAIEDDQKSGDLFINEEVMLSPVAKSKPLIIKPRTPQKENKEIVPIVIKETTNQDTQSSTATVIPTVPKTLTEQERRQLRAKRFSTTSSDGTQKAARAERFGIAAKGNGITTDAKPTGTSAAVAVDNLEKLQQRASRFGASALKDDDQARLLKRKARFGVGTTTGQQFTDEEERKRKRADRFGLK